MKIKFFRKYLSNFISLCALAVAMVSCFYSCKANKISASALQHTTTAYTEQMRPLLQLKPFHYDNGYVIIPKRKNNEIEFIIQIKVENCGKTTAQQITPIKDSMKISYYGKEHSVPLKLHSPITPALGPGQYFFLERRVEIKLENKDFTDKLLKEFNEDKVYINFDVELEYIGVSESTKYKVSGKYKIRRKNSTTLYYQIL